MLDLSKYIEHISQMVLLDLLSKANETVCALGTC